MSLELVDERYKATPETACWLEVQHRLTGKSKSEIAREVLHERAMDEIHRSNLLQEELIRKGLIRADEG